MIYFTEETIKEENEKFGIFRQFALDNYTTIYFSYSNVNRGMGMKLA